MRISDWSSDVCSSDLPEPERLVDTALAQNLDIRQAAARIDEARALRDLAAGRQLPTVAAGASVNRRRQSENGPLPIGTLPGLEASQTIYDAGFDPSWEGDLFGAHRRRSAERGVGKACVSTCRSWWATYHQKKK